MTLQKQITISRYPSSCVLLKIISATRKALKYQSKPPSTSDTQDKAHTKASSEVYTARRIEQARIVPASSGTGGWNARMTSTNRSDSLRNEVPAPGDLSFCQRIRKQAGILESIQSGLVDLDFYPVVYK
jgi:hypothetical protein